MKGRAKGFACVIRKTKMAAPLGFRDHVFVNDDEYIGIFARFTAGSPLASLGTAPTD